MAFQSGEEGLVDLDKDKSNRNKWMRNEFGQKVLDLVVNGYTEERDDDGNLKLAGNMADIYKDLKGKQFTLSEFYGVLGEEIAEKVLKWAEERGLVNHKTVGGEEYVEFL